MNLLAGQGGPSVRTCLQLPGEASRDDMSPLRASWFNTSAHMWLVRDGKDTAAGLSQPPAASQLMMAT